MTYTELLAAVEQYLENYEQSFVDNIPLFVQQAEQRIYNAVQFPALRKNVTGSLTANNKYLACPDDFLSVYSMAVVGADGAYSFLLNKDVNFIRAAYPNPNDTGLPAYYAYFDENSFILGPTPDDNYEVELHYFYYPPSIVDAGTSWLGDNFDSVLLYGSLLEAYTFMKGEADVIAEYQKRYDEALAMIKQLSEGKNRQDMYRTQQVRYPVR